MPLILIKNRLELAQKLGFADFISEPENCEESIKEITKYGADAVIEAAGGKNTFELAYKIARPNAVVALVAMYEKIKFFHCLKCTGRI